MRVKAGFVPGVVSVAALLFATAACGRNTPRTAPPAAPPRQTATPFARVDFSGIQLPEATLDVAREMPPGPPAEIVRLSVKVAETTDARGQGLMGVERLPPTAGMVFLYNYEVRNSFHMKNTLIPLDIAFWGDDGKIRQIIRMTPCKTDPCRLYQPKSQFVGALEVKAGLFKEKGVRVGDTVTLIREPASGGGASG